MLAGNNVTHIIDIYFIVDYAGIHLIGYSPICDCLFRKIVRFLLTFRQRRSSAEKSTCCVNEKRAKLNSEYDSWYY